MALGKCNTLKQKPKLLGVVSGQRLTCLGFSLERHLRNLEEVKVNRQEVQLIMYPKARLDTAGIPELVQDYKGALKFQMGDAPYFQYADRKNVYKDCGPMLEKAGEIIERLAAMAERDSQARQG